MDYSDPFEWNLCTQVTRGVKYTATPTLHRNECAEIPMATTEVAGHCASTNTVHMGNRATTCFIVKDDAALPNVANSYFRLRYISVQSKG